LLGAVLREDGREVMLGLERNGGGYTLLACPGYRQRKVALSAIRSS
jgi:hypothetical protein